MYCLFLCLGSSTEAKSLIKSFQGILAGFVLDSQVSTLRDSGSRMTNQVADGFQLHTQGLHNRNISNAAAMGRQEGHTVNGRKSGLELISKVRGISRHNKTIPPLFLKTAGDRFCPEGARDFIFTAKLAGL